MQNNKSPDNKKREKIIQLAELNKYVQLHSVTTYGNQSWGGFDEVRLKPVSLATDELDNSKFARSKLRYIFQ